MLHKLRKTLRSLLSCTSSHVVLFNSVHFFVLFWEATFIFALSHFSTKFRQIFDNFLTDVHTTIVFRGNFENRRVRCNAFQRKIIEAYNTYLLGAHFEVYGKAVQLYSLLSN